MQFPKMAQWKTIEAFRERLEQLSIELPIDEVVQSREEGSPMGWPWDQAGWRIGNRWCIHPMEGWDGESDGKPSPLTYRRWKRFGRSGAKLIWGGEAAAVQADGRANPKQLLALPEHREDFQRLRMALVESHREEWGETGDLCVGLQLTHSGRYARPGGTGYEPRIAYAHPMLDARVGIEGNSEATVWRDEELERLIERYVDAAAMAQGAGFDFVDIKACHGYLLHEFLSSRTRVGMFGGDWEGRTRLLKRVITAIQDRCPGLKVAVRLSLFDSVPFRAGLERGEPVQREEEYEYAFGRVIGPPFRAELDEPMRLLRELSELGVSLFNLSCGSPYYNPHLQRPAAYPPSDGYLAPEDPLIGVARQLFAVRCVKRSRLPIGLVGSGYTYLQQWLPQVAQAAVREGWVDFVGLGRMALSYPELPGDCLRGKGLTRKRICRTFSDCTTAPRQGYVSGCYPLDEHYMSREEAEAIKKFRTYWN